MGATVTTRCAVEVVETTTGPGFLMYEETYEKNCYPHTPTWGCVGIGRREQVLYTIFRLANPCEGGMLQNRSGRITPEGYINRWKKAFQEAHLIAPYTVDLHHKMHPMLWNDETPPPPLADIPDAPFDAARLAAWDAGEKVSLSLETDFDAIAWLIRNGRLSAWRTFGGRPRTDGIQQDVSSLIFHPRKSKTAAPQAIPSFIRFFDGDDNLFEVQGNLLIHHGWDYSVVGSYIAQYDKIEANDPGWYAQRIAAYRDHAKAAPICLPDLVLQPAIPPEGSKWAKESALKLQAQYPAGVKLSDITDRSDRYHISYGPMFRIMTALDFLLAA